MTLTNDEKAALATELCGAVTDNGIGKVHELIPCWVFRKTPKNIWVRKDKFDPVNNWNHMRLVLEGLVKRDISMDSTHTPGGSLYYALIHVAHITLAEGCHFASAVVTAGLEVLNQKGGMK